MFMLLLELTLYEHIKTELKLNCIIKALSLCVCVCLWGCGCMHSYRKSNPSYFLLLLKDKKGKVRGVECHANAMTVKCPGFTS